MMKLLFTNLIITLCCGMAAAHVTAVAQNANQNDETSVTARSANEVVLWLNEFSTDGNHKLSPENDAENLFLTSKELSLKSFAEDKLNVIERQLVDEYDDVIVSEIVPAAYFIIAGDKIGLCDHAGNVLVPPVDGYPATYSPDDLTFRMGNTISWNDQKEVAFWGSTKKNFWGKWSAGSFKAVLRKSNLHEDVPYGEYDDISWTVNGEFYYYVMIYTPEGDKWGAINLNGEIVVPCEYDCITFDKKNKIYGSNGQKMNDIFEKTFEEMDKQKDKVARMKAREERNKRWEQKRMQLALTLQSIGEGLISVANTIDAIQTIRHNGNGSFSAGGGNLQIQYSNWEKRAKMNYESLTNTGTKYKKNGDDVAGTTGQSLSPGNYVQQKAMLREAQRQMARIRHEASKKGIQINQSEWETVTVKY